MCVSRSRQSRPVVSEEGGSPEFAREARGNKQLLQGGWSGDSSKISPQCLDCPPLVLASSGDNVFCCREWPGQPSEPTLTATLSNSEPLKPFYFSSMYLHHHPHFCCNHYRHSCQFRHENGCVRQQNCGDSTTASLLSSIFNLVVALFLTQSFDVEQDVEGYNIPPLSKVSAANTPHPHINGSYSSSSYQSRSWH